MSYTFDFVNSLIDVVSPQTTVTCQDLYNAICQEQASSTGICFEPIGTASGKQTIATGTQVGITIQLLYNWQLNFYSGNYVAYVTGGNLVANNSAGAVAFTAGVQVVLVQSAASTLISDTSILSTVNTAGTYPAGTVGAQLANTANNTNLIPGLF